MIFLLLIPTYRYLKKGFFYELFHAEYVSLFFWDSFQKLRLMMHLGLATI